MVLDMSFHREQGPCEADLSDPIEDTIDQKYHVLMITTVPMSSSTSEMGHTLGDENKPPGMYMPSYTSSVVVACASPLRGDHDVSSQSKRNN